MGIIDGLARETDEKTAQNALDKRKVLEKKYNEIL
jgi:hypothetical protein